MRKPIFILSVFVCFNLTIVNAQTEEKTTIKPFGFGLHIEQLKMNDISDLSTAPVNKLIVTINPTQNFRIEPEIGFKFGSDDKTKYSNSAIYIGLGVFGMIQHNKLNIYGGLRFEYGMISADNTNYSEIGQTKETDKFNRTMVGPAIGAEYFLGENFTIGGEISILYVSINKTIDPKPTGYVDDKTHYISTNTGLFLRFYF